MRETQRQMSKRNRSPAALYDFPMPSSETAICRPQPAPRPHRSQSWSLHLAVSTAECPLCRSSARMVLPAHTTRAADDSRLQHAPVSAASCLSTTGPWALRCPRAPVMFVVPQPSFRTQLSGGEPKWQHQTLSHCPCPSVFPFLSL